MQNEEDADTLDGDTDDHDDIDDIGAAKGKGFQSVDNIDEDNSTETICRNCTISLESFDETEPVKRSANKSLLSRVNFYQILIDKFQRYILLISLYGCVITNFSTPKRKKGL